MVIETNQASPEEWDSFVRSQPAWTHFHLSGWRRVIERVYGHECLFLAARDPDGELSGVLPLVRVKSLLFGHYLVSLPFLNYGGPLGRPDAVRVLGAYAAGLALEQKVQLLELRCRNELDLDLAVSHRKITSVLDLPGGDTARLWEQLPSKLRSQIRRPIKEGVVVRFGRDQLSPFYDVFARHMRDLGTPVQTRTLFETIAEVFPEDVWFGCAYWNGRPVAAGCGFRWNLEFEMTWASALSEFKQFSANMLLYWSFLERSVREGVRLFNFGRCTPGSGTHQFKRQWGARDVPLWWYYQASGVRLATPSPDDARYAMGPRIWKRLPLAVANRVGPRLVQYVP